MSMASVTTSSAALQAHRAALLQLSNAPNPKQASLAQRLGLVAAPPPLLSAEQWLEVHLQSRLRQDCSGDCSICLRPFRAQSMVLLSCSHTFHAACLASFERFSQCRCCPLCRCRAYQKRRIADAEQLWRHTCAARIQAAWRGRAARRDYRALRRLLPPQHTALKRRWAAEELEKGSSQLVAGVERGAADIDALFAELSATAAAAGALYSQLSCRCATAAALNRGVSAPIGHAAPAAAAAGTAIRAPDARQPPTVAHHGAAIQSLPAGRQRPQQELDWEAVICRCLARDDSPECPICLAPLGQLCGAAAMRPGSGGCKAAVGRQRRLGEAPQRPQQRQRAGGTGGNLAILSCSHAYHADCLSAFEAFAIAGELGPPRCPCCRSTYDRLELL